MYEVIGLMTEKAAIRLGAAICCVGLGFLALEYDSLVAGSGCLIALSVASD